jgi:hypothetical protein
MDQGERVYRQLYGRGGLSDRLNGMAPGLNGLRGLGTTAEEQSRIHDFISSASARRVLSSEMPLMHVMVNTAAPDPTLPTQSTPVSMLPSCDCMLANLDVDEMQAAGLRSLCISNPSAFAATLSAQGIPLECTPWYAEPKNLAIGAGVVAVALIAFVALR